MRKHGKEKRRVWRKLHLAIDASTHEVISAVVSLESVGDNEVLQRCSIRYAVKSHKSAQTLPMIQKPVIKC